MGSNDRGQVPDAEVHARVAEVFRLEYGRVVASVLRIVRDIDAAEEGGDGQPSIGNEGKSQEPER